MVASKKDILDVAIVGAGVSGLYTAWRLLMDNPKLSIRIYELSERIGGRLLSVQPPRMPHVFVELGGMRYTSQQYLVRALVENKLKLPTRPLYSGQPENFAYLRGKLLRQSELADNTKIPYNLRPIEQGKDPSTLMAFAIDQIVPNASSLTPEQWKDVIEHFRFEGKPLWDWGLWGLMLRTISGEAYDFIRAAGGYDTIISAWNAADKMPWNLGDFGRDVQYHALVNGYESLPMTIYQEVLKLKGEVVFEHRLKSFDVGSEKGENLVTMQMSNSKGIQSIQAKKLVLAMPRRSIELIEQSGVVLNPDNREVQSLLRTVTPIPLFKLAICYPYPWWEELGIKQGESITDLPIRMCYYWGVEGDQWGASTKNRNACILVYDDGQSVDFWAGYRDRTMHELFQTDASFFDDEKHAAHWRKHAAPAAMVETIHRQLMEMHGLSYLPRPYAAAYRDWGEDPYGGGANFWNIHVNSNEVLHRIVQPQAPYPVYICGEAYSTAQGWVEGALQTAEILLQDHFGLNAPDWLS
jgi:monoamine oxidase